MFGIRTPTKNTTAASASPKKHIGSTEKAGPSTETQDRSLTVRKSIGEIEAKTKTVPKKTAATVSAGPSKVKTQPPSSGVTDSPPPKATYPTRLAEGRACLSKAKLQLGNSRNIKTEIREDVTASVERLYQLLKESEAAKAKGTAQGRERDERREGEALHPPLSSYPVGRQVGDELLSKMEEHLKIMSVNTEKMEGLRDTLLSHQKVLEGTTYASVAAGGNRGKLPEQATMHSVVVTSKDETETGDEVLQKIRTAVNAKEGGVTIEKIRKAKDRKVIIGCRSEEERRVLKERIQRGGDHLSVDDVKNKDPLLILKDVLTYNSDDDILLALRNQNERIFRDLDKQDNRVEVRYKKRTRNPLIHHVVVKVSPKLWNRIMDAETVQIDLQRIRVADQSPLVQCSLCLGYGHGRRFCKETIEKCSHCAGPHKKSACPDWLAGAAPTCCNCMHARMANAEHNAFSRDCPIRRRWDALARASTAYC